MSKTIFCDLCLQDKPAAEVKRLHRGKIKGIVIEVHLCAECRKPKRKKQNDSLDTNSKTSTT